MPGFIDFILNNPDVQALKQARGPLTYGFSRTDLNDFFGGAFKTEQELDALQRLAAGKSTLSDAGYYSEWKKIPGASPLGGDNLYDVVVAGLQHLSQHPAGSKIGNGMFGGYSAGDSTVDLPEEFPGSSAKKAADAAKLQSQLNAGSVGARRGRVDTFTRTPAFGLLGTPQLSTRTLGGRSLLG